MKKTYKIDVDCANCANKMEEAANKTPGVKEAVKKPFILTGRTPGIRILARARTHMAGFSR